MDKSLKNGCFYGVIRFGLTAFPPNCPAFAQMQGQTGSNVTVSATTHFVCNFPSGAKQAARDKAISGASPRRRHRPQTAQQQFKSFALPLAV